MKFRSDSGFTLLEVLIAVFIFAIAVTTIFGSFRAVFGNIESVEKSTKDLNAVKLCFNRIISDISSIYLTFSPLYKPPDFDDEPDSYRFLGETSSIDGVTFSKLRFASYSHLPFERNPRKGVAEIVYYVQKNKDQGFILTRSDKLYPYEPFEENKNDPVLCENLLALNILYYDDEGNEHENWDSDSEEFGYATQRAIKIQIKAGDENDPVFLETMISIPVFREKKEK